jgi:hypothetical protein
VWFPSESTLEHEAYIVTGPGDDMLPCRWQRLGCVGSEKVAERRPAQSVEMFVSAKQSEVSADGNAGLFPDLANGRVDQTLAEFDTACRDLRSCFGVVAVVEHK